MKHPIPSTAADARRVYLRAYQEHRDEPIAVTMARVVTEALDLLDARDAAEAEAGRVARAAGRAYCPCPEGVVCSCGGCVLR